MRWDNLAEDNANHPTGSTGALFAADAVTTRTFDTPEFRGVTFHEIRARSIVNRVPGASRMPFEWTVNPYRAAAPTPACTSLHDPIKPREGRCSALLKQTGPGKS
nr:hypothetical protein [Streptomyces sp. A0958]